jgi:hypothetical protein
MKAITTIFESMLRDESLVWSPADGPTEFSGGPRQSGWQWGG